MIFSRREMRRCIFHIRCLARFLFKKTDKVFFYRMTLSEESKIPYNEVMRLRFIV